MVPRHGGTRRRVLGQILRFGKQKDRLVGQPKAHLVIIGCHDPRVGSEVRPKAPATSRRGRSVFFMATAQNQFSVETRRVKNAFLQETFEHVPPGELAAEPVPTLRKALNLRDDELSCSRKRATD